jgi:hypothetical protein
MNEALFEDFLANAVDALKSKNYLLEEQYGIGHFARWDHDGDLEQMVFSNPDDANVLVADTTSIGSYSLRSKTWMWAWGNQSLTDSARAKSDRLTKLFDRTGMRIFSDPHVECDEYLAWELAAASVQELDGLGCYRGPTGHLWVFWSIDCIVETRPKQ